MFSIIVIIVIIVAIVIMLSVRKGERYHRNCLSARHIIMVFVTMAAIK